MSQEITDKQFLGSLDSNDGEMNFQNILNFVWRLKWWILICALVAFLVAYFYVKVQTPIYQCYEKVMLLDDRSSGSELSVIADITGNRQSKKIDDEMIILRSPAIVENVVKNLGLGTRYYHYKLPVFHNRLSLFRSLFNIKESEFYLDSPFKMQIFFNELLSPESLPGYIDFEFQSQSDATFKIKNVSVNGAKYEKLRHSICKYGDTLVFDGISVSLERVKGLEMRPGDSYKAVYVSPADYASSLVSKLDISVVMGSNMRPTNMMNLSIVDSKPKRAADILNTLVGVYNKEARDYKSRATLRSLEFIDERLESVSRELGDVEVKYRDYQSRHNFIEGSDNGGASLASEYETKQAELRMQQTFISMIKDELNRMGPDEYSVIPANVGLTDSGLNQVISKYNELVTERNRLLANSSETNPSVVNYNAQILNARASIEQSIRNLEQVYLVRDNELNTLQQNLMGQRSFIPVRQFDLAQISRKQQIIEPMFLSLNQKREELQLSLFSVTDNVRVIEPAKPNYASISPDKNKIYLLALLLGCFLPIAIVVVRRLLRTKVESKEDVKKFVDRPILVTIPRSEDASIINSSGSRDFKVEAFRMLRSNLQFVQGRVIQVTSSVSGEGKSFVASNLAISLSHVYKRVVLVGLDLRKPSLPALFPTIKYNQAQSVVGYLIGKVDDPKDIISKHVVDGCCVDVMFSGYIPPNPSELLSMERMEQLMQYCRNNYDYVICDTAPFFPVPDSTIVNKYMDITLYVIRSDYSEIRMLHDINDAISSGMLKNVSIVLNSIDIDAAKYRYGYGYGYGYGAKTGSVGYGYGYGNQEPKEKVDTLTRVKGYLDGFKTCLNEINFKDIKDKITNHLKKWKK